MTSPAQPDSIVSPARCPVAHDYPLGDVAELEFRPEYAHLRRDEPLTRIRTPYGQEGWLVTRYDDTRTVLADPRFSRAATVGADVPRTVPERSDNPASILSLDPPEHGRLRRLVASAFTARRMEALRPHVVEIAESLVDELVASRDDARGQVAELVATLSMPLPVAVICELLGVPLEGRHVFRAASDAALSTSAIPSEQRVQALHDLQAHIAGLVAERRTHPDERDDLLSALIRVRDTDGDRLSEAELVSLGAGILLAGHETTMNMIGNMVHTLLVDRSRWEALVADPDGVPAAVEEMLRFTPLGRSSGLPRIATEDVELHGGTVRAGEAVLVSMTAANRDPEVFDDPEELLLDRAPGQHIAFGYGPHHCLGAALARMELQTVLRVLIARLPGLDLAGEVQWRATSLVRGPARFPITW